MGAFLAVHWASRQPQALAGLALIAPAGLLPTSSAFSSYWAVFFKLGIPMTVFRLLGNLGTFTFAPLFHMLRSPSFHWLWLHNQVVI